MKTKLFLALIFVNIFCFSQGMKINDTIKSNEKQKIYRNFSPNQKTFNTSNNNESISSTITPISSKNNPLLDSYEFGLSLGVLIFGLILIILEIIIIKNKNFSDELLVKFILVTLIITATLFLITAGYDNNQIAPAVGLFGTVAGYLLGKISN